MVHKLCVLTFKSLCVLTVDFDLNLFDWQIIILGLRLCKIALGIFESKNPQILCVHSKTISYCYLENMYQTENFL